jgi:hypothetical protein
MRTTPRASARSPPPPSRVVFSRAGRKASTIARGPAHIHEGRREESVANERSQPQRPRRGGSAKPYDAPARGKMERFWRTLREGCLDHTGSLGSLHDLNVRLWAFIDQHYHRAPHGGLLGKSPQSVYEAIPRPVDGFDEQKLRNALTIHVRRRVRRDSTLPMDGTDWETHLHFLAGKLVTVSRCLVDASEPPWIEHEGPRPRASSRQSQEKRPAHALILVPRRAPSDSHFL